MDHLVHTFIYTVTLFLSQNNQLNVNQSSFRSGHSTETALLSVSIRGAATDFGPPGQHIHSGPPAFAGEGDIPLGRNRIAFPSPSFFPLLPNQIVLFQLLKLFSFLCNGKVIIFRFGFL